MATMAKADFLKYAGFRPGIFIDKCISNEGHEIKGKTGEQIIIGVVTGQNAKTSTATLINGAFMTNANPGQVLTNLIQNASYNYLILKDKTQVPLGHLVKTWQYQINGKKDYNKGNIAELIFSAAIVARFKAGCDKTCRIGAKEVEKIVDECTKSESNEGTLKLKSPNKDLDIIDDLVFRYKIGKPHYRAVRNKKLWPMWSNILAASIKYANSDNVGQHVHMVWDNNVENTIIVLSDGETDQKGTKIDVRVQVTDHAGALSGPDFLKISLKVDGVKQFGQMGGVTLDVQKALWKESFGVDVAMTENTYLGYRGKSSGSHKNHFKDASLAIGAVYKEVAPKVVTALETKKGQEAFSAFVQQNFSKREEGMKLVDLKGDQPIQYDAENLETVFAGLELTSQLSESKANTVDGKVVNENLPKLMIQGQGAKLDTKVDLIEIRVKRGDKNADGRPYYRNVFEKQKGFTILFAKAVED